MLAKLKVVSVLESLPGVGKVERASIMLKGSRSPRAAASAVSGDNQRERCCASSTTSSTGARSSRRRAARRSRPRGEHRVIPSPRR